MNTSLSVLPPQPGGQNSNGSALLGPEMASKPASKRPSIANLTQTPSKASIIVPMSRHAGADGERTPPSQSNFSVYLQMQRASRSRLSLVFPDASGAKGDQLPTSPSLATDTARSLRASQSSLRPELPYPTSYLASEVDSTCLSNSAIAALLHEQSAQVHCLDNAADALDDALIRVQDELNRTRAGADWQLDALDRLCENDFVSTTSESIRTMTDQSGMSLSEYTSRSTFRQNYGDNFHSAFWMDPESMLFDHQDHLFNAADAGNPDLMILPYLAPLPDILHALPPSGPVLESFPRPETRRGELAPKANEKQVAPPLSALSELDPMAKTLTKRRPLRPISPSPRSTSTSPPTAHDYLSITPAAITFTNYTPGSVYAAEIDLINRSATSISVGLDFDSPLIQLSDSFHITPRTNARLAPGMRHTLKLLFRPNALVDYEAPLMVNVVPAQNAAREGNAVDPGATCAKLQALVLVSANRPAPALVGWPQTCDMPTCPVGAMVEKKLLVTNQGGKGVFQVHIDPDASRQLFISPKAFALDQGDSVEVTVQYTDQDTAGDPDTLDMGLPSMEVPVTLTCDNESSIQTTFAIQRVSSAPHILLDPPFDNGEVCFESYPGMAKSVWVSISNPTLLPIQLTLGHVVIHHLTNHISAPTNPGPSNNNDSLASTCTTAALTSDSLSPTTPFTISPSSLYLAAQSTCRFRITYVSPVPQTVSASMDVLYGRPTPLTLHLEATTLALALALSPPTLTVPGQLPVGHTHTTHVTLTNHTPCTQRVHLDWSLENVPEHLVSCRIIDSLTSATPAMPRPAGGTDQASVCLKPGKARTVSVVWKALWPGLVVGKLVCEQRAREPGVHRWRQEVPVHLQVGPVASLLSIDTQGNRGGVDFGTVALGASESRRFKVTNHDPLQRALYWDVSMVPVSSHVGEANTSRSAVFSFVPSHGRLEPGQEGWVHVMCLPVRPLDAFRALVQVRCADKEWVDALQSPHAASIAHVQVPVVVTCSVPKVVVPVRELCAGTVWVGADEPSCCTLELINVSNAACGFKIAVPWSDVDASQDRDQAVQLTSGASWGSIPAGKTVQVEVYVRALANCQPGPFRAPILVETDVGSILQFDGDAAQNGNAVLIEVSATICRPYLACDTTAIDYGTLPLFGWTVQHVTLTNPSSLALPFAADAAFAPNGPAWTSPGGTGSLLDLASGSGIAKFKRCPTGGHIEDLKSVARQAWDLALRRMPVGLVVVPPAGVIPAGQSMRVGVWCIGTRQTTDRGFAQSVAIHIDSPSVLACQAVRLACTVRVQGSPMHLESPHMDGATRVIHTGKRTSVPLLVTNLAPYPVKTHWGLLVWQAGKIKSVVRAESAGKSARLDHPGLSLTQGPVMALDIPGQTSRVIHIAHDPHATGVQGPEDGSGGELHGVLTHDVDLTADAADCEEDRCEPWVQDGWRNVVERVHHEQMQRPGVQEGVVPITSAFLKRALLVWAKQHAAQAVYVTTGEARGAGSEADSG